MNQSLKKIGLSIVLLCVVSFSLQAQNENIKPSINLEGPRVGLSYLSSIPELLSDREFNPLITQFGWQFETKYFTLQDGTSGLIELVALIGGVEQGLFLPSVSGLMGFRTGKGFEIGFGPNLSLAGSGFVFAVGTTFQKEGVNFPLNIAYVPSRDFHRVSILFGFNTQKR